MQLHGGDSQASERVAMPISTSLDFVKATFRVVPKLQSFRRNELDEFLSLKEQIILKVRH